MPMLMEDIAKKQNDSLRPPKVGEVIRGRIIGRGRSTVYIDLGPWGTGLIYGREFLQAKEILKNTQDGQEFFVKIVDMENEDGFLELSALEADKDIAWLKLKEKKESGESLNVKILGANKGGLLANVSGINAFLPVSQLSSQNYPRVEDGDGNKILRELQKFVGQEMELRVLDLDPREEKLILSEKIKENEKIKEILKNYQVGSVVEGEVTGVVDFGAFVKFGPEGLEGLVHISELDWQLIENPADIVKIGQKVKLKIIDITDGKVSLSLRALKEDPWQTIENDPSYQKGKTISGKVTKFNPFGAFVEVAPKIQGLCHISEFRSQPKMEEALKINEAYNFEIILVDPKEHRLLLKLA
jgi:small subunit ribosomal protein S1